jgi:hypothetical protein
MTASGDAWITEQFPNELRAKGFTEEQLEQIVTALSKDPGMIALVEGARMRREERT